MSNKGYTLKRDTCSRAITRLDGIDERKLKFVQKLPVKTKLLSIIRPISNFLHNPPGGKYIFYSALNFLNSTAEFLRRDSSKMKEINIPKEFDGRNLRKT